MLTISATSSGTTATTALITDVMQHITYRNDTPAGDATIRFTLSDGSLTDTADVTVATDNIYITDTTDTASIDPTDGTSFSEAIAVAAADGSGTQTLILDSSLAGQTVSASSVSSLAESLTLNMDAASGVTLSGGTLTLGGGVTLTLNNGSSDTASISTVFAGTGSLAQTGSGAVTLTGSQTYSGVTTLTGGALSVAADTNLGSGQIVLNGGNLTVTSSTTIDNTVNVAADSTITTNESVTFSGLFSGSSTLTKAGTAQLTFSNTGNAASFSGDLTISNDQVAVTSDNHLPSGVITFDGGTLASGSSVTIDNNIVLAAGGGSVRAFGGGGSNTIILSGVISGSGDFTKVGTAKTSLTGTNTYTGATTLSGGELIIANDSSLGAGTVTLSSGTLTVTGSGITIDNALAISGGTFSNANDITWSGVVSGSGTFTKSGAGTLTLSGTQTHTGATVVSAGGIRIAGDSNLGSGALTLNGGTLTVTGTGTINNAISIEAGGGTISNADAVTLSGVMSNTGSVTKSGAGTLTLSATNTNTGLLSVSAGTVAVTGTVSGLVTVASGATLEGTGAFASLVQVNSGGTIQIGASPGTMTLSSGLTLNSGGTLVARINGTTVDTQYDQYDVSGTVTLGGTLSVDGSYTGTGGESFTIINNDGSDAVSSTFNGLTEGDESTTLNSIPLAVSYLGSTGNDVTLDVVSPDVTAGNISISGNSGTGGAYKIGDTVIATWDNTGSGDNNSDISSVTVNFSAFGGGTAVVASNNSNTWMASYTITSGAIDSSSLNVSVKASNSSGISKTTTDDANATVDNVAPTLSAAKLSISGASGTSGAYKIGDTVTATWDNTASGDNNSDTISTVTVDFSAFGGGASVAASNSSDTWTATYTITSGVIDGTNLNVSATATDNAGNTTTTSDTTNATVDNVAPTVTDANISVTSTGSGTSGAYITGDTITIAWDNTGTGDNNTDTIAGVTVDFSAFGGGAAVAASESAGTWTASYTVVSGAIDTSNLNASVTATDNAGNTTTTADTSNLTLDNTAPTVTDEKITISGASGTSGVYIIGDTVTATWDNTLATGNNNSDTIVSATVDFSEFGGGSSVTASNSSDTWTATYTIVSGAIDTTNRNVSFTVNDNAGNSTTTADTTNATVDNIAPTLSDAKLSIDGDSGTSGAYKIGDTVTATWDNTGSGDNNSDTISGLTVDFTAFGGGAAVAASESSGTWTATYEITSGVIDTTDLNIAATATDNAGNTTTTSDTTNAIVDNVVPTVTDANVSVTSPGSGDSGAYITGDTITIAWDNTGTGDNNTDTIAGVTVDFSAFGGGAAVAASESAGTWTASYTVVSGAIDTGNLNASVTATDNAGNTPTTADPSNLTLDNTAPTVTDDNITISGASGTSGIYIIGDTVTATWDNTLATGDNNSDTIASATVDFSEFGGGSSVTASNSSDTWTATYTIVSGSIDTTTLNVSFTVNDNAGNSTTTADTTNATVDNIAPTLT
ncbi:MAG: autotransporter-associated beta strand repeat-containing protein, partial [Gammaproteobacteria bacterium]